MADSILTVKITWPWWSKHILKPIIINYAYLAVWMGADEDDVARAASGILSRTLRADPA